MKKNLIKFSDFINPNSNYKEYKNKKIDINYIESCSYVKYIIIEHCNGEIMDNNFVINYDKELLTEFYFGSYIIYALNFKDDIICEVI